MTKKPGPPSSKKAVGITATFLVVAAIGSLVLTTIPWLPRLDRKPFLELGPRLGQEALQLQQPNSRIVVIRRETSQFRTPAYEAMMEGFNEVLRKAGVKIAADRVLKVDPLRVVAVSGGEYVELFRKLDDRDIIVSLMGPPLLDPGQRAAIGEKRPRVLALCSGGLPQQVNLKPLFDDKLLHAAVINRPDEGAAAQSFEQRFRIITAASLGDLPTPPSALL